MSNETLMRRGGMAGTIVVREAGPNDASRWMHLWAAYNAFYGAKVPEEVTATTWCRLLDPDWAMFCRVAEWNGTVVGFANCVMHHGTWAVSAACYLEDLFVDEFARRRGIAARLIDQLISESVSAGWSRLYWHTMESNPARNLYDLYSKADGYVRYRISPRQAAAIDSG